MKKYFNSRTSKLVVGTVTLMVLAYLAAALGNLEFAPARSYQVSQAAGSSTGEIMLPAIPLWQQILFWVLIMIMLIAVFAILAPKERKRLVKRLGNITLIILLLAYLGLKYGSEALQPAPEPGVAEEMGGMPSQLAGTPAGQPQEFLPPVIHPALPFMVTLLILAGAMALAWWLVRRREAQRPPVLEEIASIARGAVDDLSSGRDWGNTIIAFYVRMSRSVGERRGFKRKRGTTPGEFAEELARAGLPVYTTRRLTQLFERVRYGGKESSKEDIQEAIACLTDILHACGEAL